MCRWFWHCKATSKPNFLAKSVSEEALFVVLKEEEMACGGGTVEDVDMVMGGWQEEEAVAGGQMLQEVEAVGGSANDKWWNGESSILVGCRSKLVAVLVG
jgi:hypothetical protein